MKHTIEKLWNGTIVPAENCGENNPQVKELVMLMEQNRECLEKELGEHQKDILEKIVNCWDEYTYLITAQAFCDGFSLAAKLMTEALSEE